MYVLERRELTFEKRGPRLITGKKRKESPELHRPRRHEAKLQSRSMLGTRDRTKNESRVKGLLLSLKKIFFFVIIQK